MTGQSSRLQRTSVADGMVEHLPFGRSLARCLLAPSRR